MASEVEDGLESSDTNEFMVRVFGVPFEDVQFALHFTVGLQLSQALQARDSDGPLIGRRKLLQF